MRDRAGWAIVEDDPLQEEPLKIVDVGPWSRLPTVTNDAEAVVLDLVQRGYLPPGRRLFYQDSEGEWAEILVTHGKFAGFKAMDE